MPGEIAKKAVDLAVEYEKKHGRNPKVLKQGSRYDIESSGRKIEVKGLSTKSGFELLNKYNIEAINKEKEFFLYIVFDIKTNPKLLILTRDEVLSQMQIEIQAVLPLRKSDYEKSETL